MLDSLWFARCQMGLSLAFHIVFAVIGMAMPVMMVVAEAAWLRSGDPAYLDLTKRWAKGTAVFFAVSVNAWMNTPAGFHAIGGQVTDVNPLEAMMNPAAAAQVIHMLLAAYSAVGIAVAGVHARWLLIDRANSFHRRACLVALAVA